MILVSGVLILFNPGTSESFGIALGCGTSGGGGGGGGPTFSSFDMLVVVVLSSLSLELLHLLLLDAVVI